MRTFGPLAPALVRKQIEVEARALFELLPNHSDVLGEALAMDEIAERVVLQSAEVKIEGQRYRLSQTLPLARPPFEWLYEISSDLGESEYFKHYLVREDDIMLAIRKDLTPVDQQEAEDILQDMKIVREYLASLN